MKKAIEMIIASEEKIFYEAYENHAEAALPYDEVERLMKEYARLAIEEDRKNVAEHARTKRYYINEHQSMQPGEVDRDSIINAPQIKLE